MNYKEALQYFLDLANIKEDGSSFIFDFRYNWNTALAIIAFIYCSYYVYKNQKNNRNYGIAFYTVLIILLT